MGEIAHELICGEIAKVQNAKKLTPSIICQCNYHMAWSMAEFINITPSRYLCSLLITLSDS